MFDRKTEGRFPEPEEIMDLIRNRIVPDDDIGRSDVIGMIGNSGKCDDDGMDNIEDGMDDQEAEEARRYFGVM